MEYNPNIKNSYKITYKRVKDGIIYHATVYAQNKTFARRFFMGEMNPGCQIIKIEEVSHEED